jgi:O-acetyl-ADP-ribose deacetylase (regulator of RNase III)
MACSASDTACKTDALSTIKAMQALDKANNAALDAACGSPSSPACGIELAKVKTASDSYKNKSNGFDAWGVVGKEQAEAQTLASQYTLRVKNAGGYNAAIGASTAVVSGAVGLAELAITTAKAAGGDPQAQAQLGQVVKALGDFIGSPIDSTQKAIQDTLNKADALEASGQTDAAQQLRAGLVTNGLISITGAGAVVVKGVQVARSVVGKVANVVEDVKAVSAAATPSVPKATASTGAASVVASADDVGVASVAKPAGGNGSTGAAIEPAKPEVTTTTTDIQPGTTHATMYGEVVTPQGQGTLFHGASRESLGLSGMSIDEAALNVKTNGLSARGGNIELQDHVAGVEDTAFRGTTNIVASPNKDAGALYWASDDGLVIEIVGVKGYDVNALRATSSQGGGLSGMAQGKALGGELEVSIPAQVKPENIGRVGEIYIDKYGNKKIKWIIK